MDNIKNQKKMITKFYNEIKEIAREKGIEQGLDKKGYLLPFYNRILFNFDDFYELYKQFDKKNKLNDEDGYALFNFVSYIDEKLSNEVMAFEFIKNCFNEYKNIMFVNPLANLGLLGEAIIVFKGKWPFNETDNMYKISHYEKYSFLFDYLNSGEKLLEEEIIKNLNNYNKHNGLFICNKEMFDVAAKLY